MRYKINFEKLLQETATSGEREYTDAIIDQIFIH